MEKMKMQKVALSADRVKRSLKPVKRLFVEFSYLTTCHGFRQIVTHQRRPIFRFIWAALVFGLFCGLGQELYDKLHEYTDHSIVTDLHEEYVSDLEFPAVTICNINRFVKEVDELRIAKLGTLFEAACEPENRNSKEWWKQATSDVMSEIRQAGVQRYFISQELLSKGWVLNDTTLRHCSFEKVKCTLSNFTRIVTPMGTCYTFIPQDGAKQKIPGSSYGLELYIDINQFEYTRNKNDSLTSGIKILIHDKNDVPQVERFGPSVSSGHTGHIVIKKTVRHLLIKPWGKCEQEEKKLLHHEYYSVASCMEECAVHYIVNKCGCKPFWDKYFQVEECDALNIFNCSGKAEEEFPHKNTPETCNCPTPCDMTTFEVGKTSSFPSIEVSEFLLTHSYRNESINNLSEIDHSFDMLQRFGKDHVMLDIFYDKLSYTSLTERKSVSEVSLMSDVGGLLGLWLGISIVTIAEFIQFLIDAVECWIEKNKGNRMKKNDPNVSTKTHSAMFQHYQDMWDAEDNAEKSDILLALAEAHWDK